MEKNSPIIKGSYKYPLKKRVNPQANKSGVSSVLMGISL